MNKAPLDRQPSKPATDFSTLASHQKNLHETGSALMRCGELYGASTSMRHLFQLINTVAPTSANVLLSGESGTGKELVASSIHARSRERDMPFVMLNCSTVSPQHIEAELFGDARAGSSQPAQKGCFARADGGTLFLDEITGLSADLQVKLLRVLEQGRYTRVGAEEQIPVKIRVIAAISRSPQDALDSGALRRDLFYRLAIFQVAVPTLRQRGDDIELLAKLFLRRLNEEENGTKTLSKASRCFVLDYPWPGNVRELKNVVHRAFVLADQELDIVTAMETVKISPANNPHDCITLTLGSRLADAEQRLIVATLGHCGGNKTLTAETLGVSLKTLYNRLNEYQATRRATAAAHYTNPAIAVAGI